MNFPIDRVRLAFPALAMQDGGRPRIYLDNPAGTQVPRIVADAAIRCLTQTNANLGGFFSTSLPAEKAVAGAHEAMAEFLGARSMREIVIGPSMTALTFYFSRSLGRRLSAGDEIVVTTMDHEGNVSPWLTLAEERDLTIEWVPFDRQSWQIQPEALAAAVGPRTRIVALNYANNLTGSINDVRLLADIAHHAGALVYLDAVQLAPHRLIDVSNLGCDFVTCSSYKFFGPHLGIAWGREELLRDLYAYKVRPQTDDLPYRFELGTPQIELFAALEATVGYFEWLGDLCVPGAGTRRPRIVAAFEAIAAWENQLLAALVDGLCSIAGTRIIGIADESRFQWRVPTVSALFEGRSSTSVAKALARENVFVWSGHNFALETVRSLGIDEDDGVVRIGLVHYNTLDEVERLLGALCDRANRT